MDTFDNNEFIEEPVRQEPVTEREAEVEQETVQSGPEPAEEMPSSGYHGAGIGRRESPYANSPYERIKQPEPAYQYRTQPHEEQPKVKKNRKPVWKPVLAIVLALGILAGSCCATAAWVNDYWEERNEETVEMLMERIEDLQKQVNSLPSGAPVSGPLAEGESLTPGQLYNRCVSSVVAISATVPSTSYYGAYGESSGSGFVLSEDGYILTNYHVVEGATELSIITHDGEEYPAQLVGYDASTNDLAVLKVEATGLQAAKIGSSGSLVIGDMVAAIGNPLGELTSTMTVGYVSGIGREVATDSLTTISMIQTDAAINPGNSGGPLFNMRGEVIGITTAKYSGTTTSGASIEGIGFAIPIDDVMNVIDDLIEYGYVTGAYMGVSVQNVDEAADMFGLPSGAYIYSVEPGGAADRAGIKAKDIVIQLGEYPVANVTDLTRALRNFKEGDTTKVILIRGGTRMELEITLDAKPQNTSSSDPQTDPNMPSGNYDEWFEYFRRYFGG